MRVRLSIRGRLFAALLAAIGGLATAASIATYHRAKADINDLFDYEMKQMVYALGTHLSSHPDAKQEPLLRVEHDFVTQVWAADGTLLVSSGRGRGPKQPLQPGFATLPIADSGWRVFTARAGDHVLQVAQPISHRREMAAKIALNAAAPTAAMLPIGALIMWFGIGYGLRPLRVITRELKARDPRSLAPIALASPPAEVAPLVSELNALLSRLDHALEAERQFIADASHELRTPATALGLQVDLLESARTSAEREEAMRDVRRGVDRINRLIEQVLTLARLDPDNPPQCESIDLGLCLDDVQNEFSPIAAAKGVAFRAASPETALIRGEMSSLQALLRNLIGNAIRYTPEGATVTVTLDRTADTAAVRIVDSGPGIPEPLRSHVFARFVRANDGAAEGGTGLGLAIAQRAAKRLGAVFELRDRPNGEGLIAIVEIPLAATDPHVDSKASGTIVGRAGA